MKILAVLKAHNIGFSLDLIQTKFFKNLESTNPWKDYFLEVLKTDLTPRQNNQMKALMTDVKESLTQKEHTEIEDAIYAYFNR